MDKYLLYTFNHPGILWRDHLMIIASNRVVLFCYVLIAAIWIATKTHKRWRGALLLLVCVGMTEILGAYVIKPMVHRPRPCMSEIGITAIRGCNASGSMPSDHAAIVAATATILFWVAPSSIVITLPIALLVGLSRSYLGMHYPSDVLAGYLLGIVVALLILAFEKRRCSYL